MVVPAGGVGSVPQLSRKVAPMPRSGTGPLPVAISQPMAGSAGVQLGISWVEGM
jgi:hypothetical protein